MHRVPLALLAVGLCAASCGEPVGGLPCPDPSLYPYCSADGASIVRCVDGEERVSRCAIEDAICVDIVDPDSAAVLTGCFPPGTETCDATTFVSRCLDAGAAVQGCEASGDHPRAGNTYVLTCAEGDVCKSHDTGAACVSPDAEPCDYPSYVSSCVGNAALECDWQTGFTKLSAPCADGTTCIDSGLAGVCQPPDAEICDPATHPDRCVEDGAYGYCSPFDGFVHIQECRGETRCLSNGSDAGCVPVDAPLCDQNTFTNRCEGDLLVRCVTPGFEEAEECAEGHACRTSPIGSFCVAPNASACEPSTPSTSYCSPGGAVYCEPSNGFEYTIPCGGTLFCLESGGAAHCVPQGTETCVPSDYAGFCQDEVATTCNIFSGLTSTFECAEGEVCVTDEMCFEDQGCWLNATCVDDSLPRCPEPSGASCRGRYGELCVGGYLHGIECPSQRPCVTDGVILECAQPMAPPCDVATFRPVCEGDMAVTCWGTPGRVFRQDCRSSDMDCVMTDEGPDCQ